MDTDNISCELSCMDEVADCVNAKLTDEQKKTVWEWAKYLGKALITAIVKKLMGMA